MILRNTFVNYFFIKTCHKLQNSLNYDVFSPWTSRERPTGRSLVEKWVALQPIFLHLHYLILHPVRVLGKLYRHLPVNLSLIEKLYDGVIHGNHSHFTVGLHNSRQLM